MSRTVLCLRVTGFSVGLLAMGATARAESSRPPAHGVGAYASPVTETRRLGDRTEGEAFLEALAPSDRARLERDGQVLMGRPRSVHGSYGGLITAVALFHQSKERTFDLIIQPTRQPLYLPRLVSAVAEETPPHGELVAFTIKVVFVKLTFHTFHWFYPETSRVEWALDPSRKNDIAGQEGFWQLYAVSPTLTIGEYGTRVDTGRAVPRSLQDYLARKDIPKALAAIRAYVDSNGAYRRPD